VAPNSLTILRGEVRDAVEQANRDALESSFSDAADAMTAAGSATPSPLPAPEPSATSADATAPVFTDP